MKNILFLFSLVALFALGVTQNEVQAQTTYTFAADTLTDVDTGAQQYPTRISANNVIAFGITATELTGAATLTASLEGAVVDGEWFDIEADSVMITAGSPNSFTRIFTVADSPYKYYRVTTSQTGTATTEIVSTWVFKKK